MSACPFQVGDRIHQLTLMTSLNLMVPDDHYPHATVTEITPEGFTYEYDVPFAMGRAEWGSNVHGWNVLSRGVSILAQTPMNTFTYTPDPSNKFDHVNVTVSTEAEEMDKVISAFEGYLRAVGFQLNGKHLEVVNNE